MRLTRDFYRPSEARVEHVAEIPGSEICRYEHDGTPLAAVFGGRRSKPDWHFRFQDEAARENRIRMWKESQISRLAETKKRRKARSAPHGFEVGQLFYCSWGYDQTNIDYYMLTKLKGKTMGYIVPIGSKTVSSNPPQEMVVPDPEHIRRWDVLIGKNENDGPPEAGKWKRLTTTGFSPSSHYHASPCDADTARYETSAGWGH